MIGDRMAAGDRRRFLKRAAGAAAAMAPMFAPAAALGRAAGPPPSERITLGFIGVGMMGRGHLRLFTEYDDAQVLAVCDVDQWRREHAAQTVETAYAARAEAGAYRGCSAYRDLRELLARDDIDAVVIATGDRWHAAATVLAARAGKDVYCEKPISLTIYEARAMVRAVRRYDRVCQIGLQQRSTYEFRKACRLVREGRIGRVRRVYVGFPGTCGDVSLPPEEPPQGLDWDLWLGPAPWRPFNSRFHHYGAPQRVVPWHFCRDFGGLNLTSNTVHAFDVVQWGLGKDDSGPVEVSPPEANDFGCLTYRYDNGVFLHVTWTLADAGHDPPPGWDVKRRIRNFGALFVGDDGWIHVGREGFLEAHPAEVLRSEPREAAGDHPVGNHHQNWLAAVRARRRPACDIAVGAQSTIVSHLGCIAHWTGRRLRWDPAAERFVGDEQANRWRRRAMREPWGI